MPELPEVETTVRGLKPHLLNKRIQRVNFLRLDLRYPLDEKWINILENQTLISITRRAKFILFTTNDRIHFSWHLGMSGSLRMSDKLAPLKKHDHILIDFEQSQFQLRFHDPRRFGWVEVYKSKLEMAQTFKNYGVEPLSDEFSARYMFQKARRSPRPIKSLIMDQKLVVGVGNIYASEALFRTGIHPTRASNRVSFTRIEELVDEIKKVLVESIDAGGTTLKDFINPDAKPGYFAQTLKVYGRDGQPCVHCARPIRAIKINGRSSFYCPQCQR